MQTSNPKQALMDMSLLNTANTCQAQNNPQTNQQKRNLVWHKKKWAETKRNDDVLIDTTYRKKFLTLTE